MVCICIGLLKSLWSKKNDIIFLKETYHLISAFSIYTCTMFSACLLQERIKDLPVSLAIRVALNSDMGLVCGLTKSCHIWAEILLNPEESVLQIVIIVFLLPINQVCCELFYRLAKKMYNTSLIQIPFPPNTTQNKKPIGHIAHLSNTSHNDAHTLVNLCIIKFKFTRII